MLLPVAIFVARDGLISEPLFLGILGVSLILAARFMHSRQEQNRTEIEIEEVRESTTGASSNAAPHLVSLMKTITSPPPGAPWDRHFDRGTDSLASTYRWLSLNAAQDPDDASVTVLRH
jgi:hypothetical protein